MNKESNKARKEEKSKSGSAGAPLVRALAFTSAVGEAKKGCLGASVTLVHHWSA